MSIEELCEKLNLSMTTTALAKEYFLQAEAAGMTNGRRTSALIASCVYLAGLVSGQWVRQIDVQRITDVSCTTIKTRYKEIIKKLGIDELVLKDKNKVRV